MKSVTNIDIVFNTYYISIFIIAEATRSAQKYNKMVMLNLYMRYGYRDIIMMARQIKNKALLKHVKVTFVVESIKGKAMKKTLCTTKQRQPMRRVQLYSK